MTYIFPYLNFEKKISKRSEGLYDTSFAETSGSDSNNLYSLMPSSPWSLLMILADDKSKTSSLNLFNNLAKGLNIFLGQDMMPF